MITSETGRRQLQARVRQRARWREGSRELHQRRLGLQIDPVGCETPVHRIWTWRQRIGVPYEAPPLLLTGCKIDLCEDRNAKPAAAGRDDRFAGTVDDVEEDRTPTGTERNWIPIGIGNRHCYSIRTASLDLRARKRQSERQPLCRFRGKRRMTTACQRNRGDPDCEQLRMHGHLPVVVCALPNGVRLSCGAELKSSQMKIPQTE